METSRVIVATFIGLLLVACPEEPPSPADIKTTDVGTDLASGDVPGGADVGADTDDDVSCDPSTVCGACDAAQRECTPNAACNDATCGDCLAGYVDEGGTCVAAQFQDCATCAAQFRACDTVAGGTVCGDCIAGYGELAGACEPIPSCEETAPGSIVQQCDQLNRECVPATADAPAQCGDCITDYIEAVGLDGCIFADSCASDGDCAGTDVCIQLGADGDPLCQPAPCPDGEAWDRTTDSCRSCPSCAAGPALTGDVWPATDASGNCVCETNDGHFWDPSSSGIEGLPCDADGDGWTNAKLLQVLATASASQGAPADDWSLLLNVNCSPTTIDGITLVNEWGQSHPVTLTDLGVQTATLTLYESDRNDRDTDAMLPTLGDRPFAPEEVNALTKTCAAGVDLNDNGTSDAAESHDTTTGPSWQQAFNQLSHFGELFSTALVDQKLVITARSRCDAGAFPLGYPAGGSDYWRSCTRRRGADYVGDALGHDFASFDCSSPTGACVVPSPAAPTPGGVPPHGLCDNVSLASDAWRGMTHYAQFRCVTVRNTDTLSPGEIHVDQVLSADNAAPPAGDAGYHVNVCGLGQGTGTYECSVSSDAGAGAAALDQVVWVAQAFTDYNATAEYAGGCVNEWTEWPQLCPAYGATPGLNQGQGDPNAFGQISCSCPDGYQLQGDACVDIDECATNPCDTNAMCSNSDGSHSCECNAGFEGDGVTCTDIDECTTGAAGCWVGTYASATCLDTDGGFTCTCPVEHSDLSGGAGTDCSELPDEDLFGYYPLDAPETVFDDTASNDHDGSLYAPNSNSIELVTNRAGVDNKAWVFRADVDGGGTATVNYPPYIPEPGSNEDPYHFGGANPFTLSLWWADGELQGYSGGPMLETYGGGYMGIYIYGGDGDPWEVALSTNSNFTYWADTPLLSTGLSDGGWHHLAFVYSGTTITLIIDGDHVNAVSATTTWPGVDNWVLATEDQQATGQQRFDDIRIYRRALSAGSVTTLAGE